MTLTDRLLALAELWAEANARSEATLATRVVRDGKLFERLRAGRSCTAATADRLFAHFRDPANWPGRGAPSAANDLLDNVDLGLGGGTIADHSHDVTSAHAAPSSGNTDHLSAADAGRCSACNVEPTIDTARTCRHINCPVADAFEEADLVRRGIFSGVAA